LKKHFENAINTGSNADIKETPNKDKGFINAILSLPDNKAKPCNKYNYLGEYYRNDNKFKEWAVKYKGKSKDLDEDRKENKENKENEKPPGGMAIFGNLGGGGNKDEEDDGMGADLVDKLKAHMEQDFASFRNEISTGITGGVGGLGKKIKISKEESDKFNNLLSEFLKNFIEISDAKNIALNIETVTNFFYKHNGSSKIAELRKKIKFQNIDILDLWEEVDTWDKLDFKRNIMSKYVF
jgi:DNA mismatch repair ATPase MutL